MKKLIYLLLILCPIAVCAQQSWEKSSPLDLMWQNIGNAGFSTGQAGCLSLALNPSGEPFVAFRDGMNPSKVTVMKFDGTNWMNVGNAGFSAGGTNFLSLKFSPSGQPYVAFQDE